MEYTYIELCAGCGGLSQGLEQSGLKPKLLIDNDRHCVETLKLNFSKTKIKCQDISDVNFAKYRGKIDIVCGGIPCQSFSIAGKREGLNDTRGNLFFQFLRCIKEVKPKLFLMENVEGLTTINNGETFQMMIKKFQKIGYTMKYRVVNAVDYKVPQKRKRLIIIGTLPGFNFKFPKPIKQVLTLRDALKNVPTSDGIKYSDNKKKIMKLVPPGGCWINLPVKIQKEYMGKSYTSGGGKRGMARRLSWNEPCLTLTTSPCQKQTERCHPDKTRPLTTREYARIQTFPDTFKFHGSVAQIYKQIGNAVPCRLAYYLGKTVIKCLNKNRIKLHAQKIFKEFYESKMKQIYEDDDIVSRDVDQLKKVIDQKSYNISETEWNNFENARLKDKKLNNKIGELNELLLSSYDGWQSCNHLKKFKFHGVDARKKDNSVFLEIKNKHNTLNCASRKQTIKNLIKIKEQYPNAIVAIGIINGKDDVSIIHQNPEIRQYSGEELFKLVFGYRKAYQVIINAIKEFLQ